MKANQFARPRSVPRPNRDAIARVIPIRTPEQRALTDAFLACAGALHRRPEPRHLWDSRARDDSRRVPHPADDAVFLLKGCMKEAIETGDQLVIRATRLSIEAYFDRCMSAVMSVGEVLTDEASFTEVMTDECDAMRALTLANDEASSPGMLSDALAKCRRASDSLMRLVRGSDRRRVTSTEAWL